MECRTLRSKRKVVQARLRLYELLPVLIEELERAYEARPRIRDHWHLHAYRILVLIVHM